ncbi:substrate-binding periplasmic protein [Pseudoteredinibacter isoporae]|uniref:ABC-type amino acid transport substrate-binding protein n=1 Tax=Pseudoteredinibacter isoporae TaxID=570281 RepID=A0A7X0MUK4_9GAMM|nr:transporter substrate-binding domain-containing protein [Pseudoteredinibacter isoporae]MBB6520125.1 ABC-type amino acid transport substrate-binding protein [Pseudoteredinibacter isoporae]NHO85697.1 ABC transporter substrate-binding protein [Pseudoteredinibacter isoporae]NIB25851.1 ABC transporter substrate-binding protein [Pseudoteredinibacter isoporae]
MNRVSFLTLSVCSFVSSALAVDTSATQSDRAFRFTTVEYPPFVICDENNMAIEGLDIRIISEAMAKANLELEIHCTPWRRSIHEVATGNFDGVLPIYLNQKRLNWGRYLMTPLHYESYVIVSNKDNDKAVEKFSDLFHKTIGLNSGFYVNKQFSEAQQEKRFELKQFNTTELGIKALQRNRLQYYLSNITVLGYTATQMGVEDSLHIQPKRFTMPRPTYLALSRKSPKAMKLAPVLGPILEEMRSSGELKKINDQYLDKELMLSDHYCPQHVDAVTIDW